MGHRRTSLDMCYITFKIRISFREHMKKGAHLMASGHLASGLWGNSCCCWIGSVWRHKTERVHLCNVCLMRLLSLCQCLPRTKFGSTVAMCLPASVVSRRSTPTTPSTDKMSLCVTSLTTRRVFAISPCGARITIEEIPWTCGRGGSRRGRGRFWPAPGRGQTSSIALVLINLFM